MFQYLSPICFFSTMSQMKWYFKLKCLDMVWWIGFYPKWMALMLSQKKRFISYYFSHISSSTFLIHNEIYPYLFKISNVLNLSWWKAIYPYFLEIHVISPKPSEKSFSLVDFLSSIFIPQSLSLKPNNFIFSIWE